MTSEFDWLDSRGAVAVPSTAAFDQQFLDIVSRSPISIFCDIGSRDGEIALRFKQLRDDCSVFAFEANPENYFEHFNRLSASGIQFLPIALSDKSGSEILRVPAAASIAAGRIPSRQQRGIASLLPRLGGTGHVEYQVPAARFSDFFPPALTEADQFALWLDVEGATAKVLDGIEQRDWNRTLFLKVEVETKVFWEGQDLALTIFAMLERVGFRPISYSVHELQFDVSFVNGAWLYGATPRPVR